VDLETTRIIITVGGSVLAAFGGVGLGYALSLRATRNQQRFQEVAAEREREFRESQRVRELQENAAREFARGLNEAGREVPTGQQRRSTAAGKIAACQKEIREAWGDARPSLRDPAIIRANHTLDTILFIAWQDCAAGDDVDENFFPIGLAFSDLQDALSAFIVREKAPVPRLPEPGQLNALAYPDGENLGLEGIARWVADQGL
jgi:hypothetical protein